MKPDLQPTDALSQVVFIHDYLQLVFQDCDFTLYNPVSYELDGSTLKQGQVGFCDAVVALIDQTATVHAKESGRLTIQFVRGAAIHVPSSGPHTRGPEAWQFNRIGAPTVVAQNV
jgi:hypothetical protein